MSIFPDSYYHDAGAPGSVMPTIYAHNLYF